MGGGSALMGGNVYPPQVRGSIYESTHFFVNQYGTMGREVLPKDVFWQHKGGWGEASVQFSLSWENVKTHAGGKLVN